MKEFILALFLISASAMASENGVWLTSADEDSTVAKIPQSLMAIFVDQGFKQKEISPKIFELSVTNLRCDYQSRDALYPDQSNAGLPSVKCYINASPEMNGKGVKIEESRYLQGLLDTIGDKRGLDAKDCAMCGKCVTFVKTIRCWLDLNMEEMKDAYNCFLK